MSTQKVTDLTALASADDDDVLLISDVSESASKKITVANLVNSKVTTAVSNLVDSAPEALDTLNELAAALGDDANFATTVTTSIGTKWTQDNTKISNWDTAYGWGDHASAGYLTSFTETNDLTAAVTWTNIPDANVPQSAVTQHQAALSITEGQISNLGSDIVLDSDIGVTVQAYDANLVTYATNGNTAYGWGDHASEGYLTSYTETDPIVGAVTGIVKADGAGNISAASAGTDYQAPLTAGTDYLAPTAIGVTVQGYDADTAKYDDVTANFTGTLQNGGHTVLTNASDYLDSADIGVSVQAYDADTAKYDDTTANFTGTLQNGGSNVVVDTDIGSTVQAYDANLPTWPSSVSATEVGYLDGVTSAIQTQLDTKASTGKAIAMAIVFG